MNVNGLGSKMDLELSDARTLKQVSTLVKYYRNMRDYAEHQGEVKRTPLEKKLKTAEGSDFSEEITKISKKFSSKKLKALHGFRIKIDLEFTEVGMPEVVDEIANINKLVADWNEIYEYIKVAAKKKRKELKKEIARKIFCGEGNSEPVIDKVEIA